VKADPYYPRILIVNAHFTEQSGSGTFLGRLFSGWPIDNIATVCGDSFIPDWKRCRLHFRSGEFRFPMNKLIDWFGPSMSSGVVHPSTQISASIDTSSSNSAFHQVSFKHRVIRLLWRLLLRLLGGGEIFYSDNPSPKLLRWIQNFKPEVIYGHCTGINSVVFLLRLQEVLNIPLVLHLMDDWSETNYRNGLLAKIIRPRFEIEFNKLMQIADVRIAICEEMAKEYILRYQTPVSSLPMPVELDAYSATTRNNWAAGKPFRLRYGGRVGWAINDCLLDIAKSIHLLRQNGVDVVFDLVTFQTEEVPAECYTLNGVNVQLPGALVDLPRNQSEADVLIICYDFDPKSISQARYSMPSKLADCMASGTPILVYGPAGLPVVEYARRERWGKVVDTREPSVLQTAVCELIASASLRERFGHTARELALKRHDSKVVSEEIRRILMDAVGNREELLISE